MKAAILGMLLALLCVPVAANVHTELRTALTVGYATHEQSTHNTQLSLRPALEADLSPSVQARASLRIRGLGRDELWNETPDLSSFTNASKPYLSDNDWLLELRDAWFSVALDNTQLKIGKQQIVWGALDGIKVLDILNPQSFEQFILQEFDESRIGLWSIYVDWADWAHGGWRMELALIPDTTTHQLPKEQAWFALRAPRFNFGFPTTATGTPSGTQSGIQSSTTALTNTPRTKDRRGAAALRMSRFMYGLDVQIIAASTLDFEPLGSFGPRQTRPSLHLEHKRQHIFGLGVSGSFAQFAWRGEFTYSPDRTFNHNPGNLVSAYELDHIERKHVKAGVGIDWNAPFNLFVNVQYLHDHVLDAPAGLTRPDTDRLVTAFAKRSFMHDTLDLQLRYYSNLDLDDQLLRLKLRYALSDTTFVAMEYDEFKGNQNGFFGQFEQQDQLTLTLEHTF